MPGLCVEGKARAEFAPLSWLKQATDCAAGDIPIVVWRPNGYGLAQIDQWPLMTQLGYLPRLWTPKETQ